MQNWFGIETEAAYRRSEWERAVRASARATPPITSGRRRRSRRWRPALALLRSLSGPRLALRSPWNATARGSCAPSPWKEVASP